MDINNDYIPIAGWPIIIEKDFGFIDGAGEFIDGPFPFCIGGGGTGPYGGTETVIDWSL